MTNWFRTAPTVGIDDYKRQRGESKLIELKDARIMQLVGQLDQAKTTIREMPKTIATRCVEIASKHECRCAADEISREFKLNGNGGHQ